MFDLRPALALTLAFAVFCSQASAVVSQLSIKVLEGEGALNNINRRIGRNVRILVQDENGAVVPGAKVVFTSPALGPGVTFGQSGNRFETTTAADGTASTPIVVPNAHEGTFGIKVVVSSGGAEQTRTIRQSNTTAGGVQDMTKRGGSRRALLLAIIGGGAAAGAVFALKGSGGGSPAAGPSVISLGGVSVGGPR